MTKEERKALIPVWEKTLLTVEEASAYTGIGLNRLREIADYEAKECVLWVGNKRMLKRKKLEEFIDRSYSI